MKSIESQIRRIHILITVLALATLAFHFDVVRRLTPKPKPDLRTVVRIQGDTGDGLAVGTGVLISPRRILTNAHVVEGMVSLHVEYNNAEIYEGRILKIDKVRDLALIEIDRAPGAQAVIGEDDAWQMEIGHELYFIGASGGLSAQNLTKGNLTSKGIRISEHASWWQASAAIANGNSGGPVFDAETGFLVGLATSGWVIPPSSPFMPPVVAPNIAFFIPAYQIRAFLDDETTNSPPPVGPSLGTPETKTEVK